MFAGVMTILIGKLKVNGRNEALELKMNLEFPSYLVFYSIEMERCCFESTVGFSNYCPYCFKIIETCWSHTLVFFMGTKPKEQRNQNLESSTANQSVMEEPRVDR